MEIPAHTYMLLRCLEYKYARAFIEKGSMKFTCPTEWSKPDGTSRGDVLEGVFASQRGINPQIDKFLRSLRNDVFTERYYNYTFYKSQEILTYRVHCMYGLNSTNMHMQDVRSQDHRYHLLGRISKEFFQHLYPKVNAREIDMIDKDMRPVVLLIRPDYFVDYVAKRLMERGLYKNEIIISPVSYRDYYRDPFIIGKEPLELFSKSEEFSEQCEIRIVIDTHRKQVQDLIDDNGVIELGPIDDSIAILSEFYFDEMVVEIRDNKLLYTLAKPIEYDIDGVDDTSLGNL